MFDSNQLLLTLLPADSGGPARARYVLLRGRTVRDEGECALAQLPAAARLRASWLARSSYFDQAEVQASARKMLPFQARRLVDATLAFSEAFRLRYAAAPAGSGRYRLDMLAVNESDYSATLQRLGARGNDCERLALAENALAALLALETPEPAALLWQRGPNLLALLVENGAVRFKLLDRDAAAAPGAPQAERLERVRAALDSAARRLYPERELSLTLLLGELAGTQAGAASPDVAASAALAARLQRRFGGAQPQAVLLWPEVYGLQALPPAFDLLEPEREQLAKASTVAWAASAVLGALALTLGAGAWYQHSQWQQVLADYEPQRAALQAEHAALQARLPTPAQLQALEAQIRGGGGGADIGDFRVDSLLAWVSQITPSGATVRHLEVTRPAAPAAPAPLPVGVVAAPGAAVPAGAAQAVPGLLVEVRWELRGDYPRIEALTAQLTRALGQRATLQGSQLSYGPAEGAASTAAPGQVQAQFATTLLPHSGAFR